MAENTQVEFEQKLPGSYYLDDPKLRLSISEKFPDIKTEQLDKIDHPKISEHPDELEKWEAAMREKRNEALISSASGDQIKKLQMCLYEECFGVNASPGINSTFHESLAPTLGGLISHGHPRAIMSGQTLETVARLNFTGNTAKECVDSLSEYREKDALSNILAEITFPTELGNSMSERLRDNIRRQLGRMGIEPREEVTTWALRLVKIVKEAPELTKPLQDPDLKNLLGIKADSERSLLDIWPMLWSQMSRALIMDNGTYKNTDDETVQKSLEKLLKIRLHPETQVLFKYLSPSGYLN